MLPHPSFPDGLDQNFTAYIPRQLTSLDLRLAGASSEAVGFPRRITYAGDRPALTTPERRPFAAEYRPRFETFIHAGSCCKLTYTWVAGGPFHVDVLHNRETGEWNVYKFSAGGLLSHAFAQSYGEAMIRASGIGLHAAEPAFTFTGDPEECRRENLAQARSVNQGEPEAVGSEPGGDSGPHTLVFGIVPCALGGSNLVFVPAEKARELAAIHEALRAKTWDEDPFKLEAVPGSGHGAWPERPEQAMLRWLPPLVCGRWGRRVNSRRRGDYLIFDPGHAPEILADLEAAGFSCRWDEELVRQACGTRAVS